MSDLTIEQQLLDVVCQPNDEQKQNLLNVARELVRPKGETGKMFLEHTRNIHIDPDDLKLMQQAIEEWCERIDDFPEVNFDE